MRSRPSDQSRQGRQSLPQHTKRLSPLAGLRGWRELLPTVETVGFFRVSLSGQRGRPTTSHGSADLRGNERLALIL